MSAPNREKGIRYLGQLDQALCNGSWSEIQELARKTDKHAPERKCLTLAARSEAQIASASHRPTSAASTASASIHSLGGLVPKLTDAIGAAEEKFHEDAYAARVCLAEVHWLRSDWTAVLEVLATALQTSKGNNSQTPVLGWLEVCDVKAAFFEAVALESCDKQDEARQRYLHMTSRTLGSRTPELRRWTERLLARGCMFMKRRTTSPTYQNLEDALRLFHSWSEFWQRSPPSTSSSATFLDIPRREVWKAYYDLLSLILNHGLLYNSTSMAINNLLFPSSASVSDEQYTNAKLRQRADMKRVEATYESLLLNETQFPKASQVNTEVEEWVDEAISNWRIFTSDNWTDAEIGHGGKEGVSRNVLDILYRAATKTFHSTRILRHLFTVHTALGEFDLAMHAFNSYVEIISKGRARAEKTGKRVAGFDSDDTAVLTAAEAVRVLCRYGDHEQAKKATEVSETIEQWLQMEAGRPADTISVQQTTLAAAHYAIGISRVHWASFSHENETRKSLRKNALESLREAQKYDELDLNIAYALALLYADTRDLVAAQEVLRKAIKSAQASTNDEDSDDETDNYETERRLVPLWHLLALCLTAKDDYGQAVKVCDAAFDQFGDTSVLLGDGDSRFSEDSEKSLSRSTKGLIDQMEGLEKASFLQIKMTRLTLLELMDGPDAAVDASHELLGLYAKLFGNPGFSKPSQRPPQTATSAAPSKVGGTLRSIAGSIRPRSARTSLEKRGQLATSLASVHEKSPPTLNEEPEASNGVPIAITVTNEDGVSTHKQHDHRFPFKLRGHHGDWREHRNLKGSKSMESLHDKSLPKADEKPPPPVPSKDSDQVDHALNEKNAKSSPEQPLGEIKHNRAPDAWPPPAGHEDQPPRQDVRLPAPRPVPTGSPPTRLASAQDKRFKICVLVDVWLFVAGLYLRAELLDDASGAIDEAQKHVESYEAEMVADDANARRLFTKGWGAGKSVDALWADVWAARGDLLSARDQSFRALHAYEQAVAYHPDHPEGIIGLSNLLMDIYEEKMPIEEPQPTLQEKKGYPPIPPKPSLIPDRPQQPAPDDTKKSRTFDKDPSSTELNRLAARDRAYMLLNTLTKLDSASDNSEAWLTLARAHELSKQIGKAKEALWWVVELEDTKPVRPWRNVGDGGFTL